MQKCLPNGPKPTKEALATAKASHVPKGGGHLGVNHARNFSFLYTRVAGEFLSCSARMGSCLVGEGGGDSKSSFLLSSG